MIVNMIRKLTLISAIALMSILSFVAPAAAENPDYTAPPPSTPVVYTTTSAPETSDTPLPATGSDPSPQVIVGCLLVVVGVGMVIYSRRPRS